MKIDITFVRNPQIVEDYVRSRYFGELTAAERMASSAPGTSDPFASIEGIRADLDKFVESLRSEPNLDAKAISLKLSEVVTRQFT